MPKALQFIFIAIALCSINSVYGFDAQEFIDNFANRGEQTVRVALIDSLTFRRGQAEFHLGKGILSLLDFGSGIPCAMVFEGKAQFVYTPPDDTEEYQLKRLFGKEKVNWQLDKLTFFYTIDLSDQLSGLVFDRQKVSDDAWHIFSEAAGDAFEHFGTYMPNNLLNDLLASRPGIYFYADIHRSRFEQLVFIEDQQADDSYRLYRLRTSGGIKVFDTLGGYTPDNSLVSQRGVVPIDVVNYRIQSTIDRGGQMKVNCLVHFIPKESGRKFLYWSWFYKNKPLAALDPDSDSLLIINKNNEWGLGIVLDEPSAAGQEDSLDIVFDCGAVKNYFGIYFVDGQTFWYPMILPLEKATYDLSYECVADYELVSCGHQAESKIEDGKLKSRWVMEQPVKYVSFNLGVFKTKKFNSPDAPPVIVYQSKNFRHDEYAERYAGRYDNISSADMLDQVGRDVSRSLEFFTQNLGPCPFDTIRVSEIPYGHGQGSPGLLHLTYYTFQFDDLIGSAEMFRAHEVSHQWWGHAISNENQRDTWIDEGLADYCGYLYFESIAKNPDALHTVRENWTRDILRGRRREIISTDKYMAGVENYIRVVSDGTKAGPITLGERLDNEKSHDYLTLVYNKGAYVYHMIRYLMHDYDTGSDEAFWEFLRDMLSTNKNEPITTEGLKALLEENLEQDMTWFFDQWVYGIDIPTYKFKYDTKQSPDGKYEVTCHVNQQDVPEGFRMPVPIAICDDSGGTTFTTILVDKPENEIKLPPLPMNPKSIDFNTYDAVLCKVKE